MADAVENVAERLARLEVTVAQGFFEAKNERLVLESRMESLESKFDALNNKFDVVTDSLRGDINTVREAVTSLIEDLRRTTESIRKEHAADREILKLALLDRKARIERLERSADRSGAPERRQDAE